jgi:Tfp pilus assembly protein PilO
LTRQTKLIILVAYLLFLTIVMLAYRSDRTKKTKQLKAEIARVDAEKDKNRKGEAELARISRLIPAESNSTGVIESLYGYAKDSGLTEHYVATEADNRQTSARPNAVNDSGTVTTNRIKINVAGSFRQIAEYIRRVQSMQRFNRITEFKLTPAENMVKGTLTLEIFSMPVKP